MSKNEDQKKKGTFIHGIGASEHLDSSGERIKVSGIDISSLTKDGVFNFEHQSKEATAIVGKITEAKKILKESDCDNERHKYFWNKIKKPYLYVAGELFDADGHQAAKDVAAMLKYDVRNKGNKETKKLVNFSIEGQKLENKGSEITKSIARKVSITITPCNKVCEAELLDPKDIENGEKMKKFGDHEDNFSFIQDLMSKNEGHFASCEPLEKNQFETTVKPDTGYGKIINVSKPKTENPGKVIKPTSSMPKPEGYGKVIQPTSPKPKKEGFGGVILKDEEKKKTGKVTMPASEAVEEHEHLVDVLESKSHKDDKKEAKKQKKELKEYKEQVKKADEEIPFPLGAPDKEKALKELYSPKKKKDKKPESTINRPQNKLEKDDAPEQLYHIRYQGNRITTKPQSLKEINEKHGNVKNLESQGYRLVHHKPTPAAPAAPKIPSKKMFGKAEELEKGFHDRSKDFNLDRERERSRRERSEKGVNTTHTFSARHLKGGKGTSNVGRDLRAANKRNSTIFDKVLTALGDHENNEAYKQRKNKFAKDVARRNLADLKTMPKPNLPKTEKSEEIIEKFEFFNRVANRFNQFMNRRAIDQTARRMQSEREAQGKQFDPDATVIAGPEKTTLGAEKRPEVKPSPLYMPKDRRRMIFPPDEQLLNPKPTFAPERSPEETAKVRADIDTTLNLRAQKASNKKFTEQAKAKAKQAGTTEDTTTVIKNEAMKYQNNMRKALTAGSMMGAPSTLTGGAALQRENLEKKQGVPKGADPATHERCVKEVKAKGHDKPSAYAICNEVGAGKKKKKKNVKKSIATAFENDQVNLPSKTNRFTKAEKIQALKLISDQAFNQFEKKEELLDFLLKTMPEKSEKELVAIAKSVAYIHLKKKELILEDLIKSKNVREQRKKVFGTNAMPSKGSKMHEKHMQSISDFVENFLGLKLQPSGGKLDEETGQRRGTKKGAPQIGTDKPDWRSGELEAQWNPDAALHELGHLFLLPKGIGLEEAQKLMDKQYSEVQTQYGYQQQKRSKYEVQPMATEQLIRRVIGLPATEHDAPTGYEPNPIKGKPPIKRYEKDDPRKTSVENPEQEIALRLPKSQMRQGRELKERIKQGKGNVEANKEKLSQYGNEYHDLVRLSKLLTPENRQRVHRRLSGQERFHPVHGWHDADTPDANINRKVEAPIQTDDTAAPEEPVKKSEELAKAKVYDLASRKMVADTDQGDNPQQALDAARAGRSPQQTLNAIRSKAQTQNPFAGLDPIQTIHKKIAARFGGQPPQTLLDAIRISEEEGGHDEPYAFGDIHNVVHGSIRHDKHHEGMWNRPMPMPMRVNLEKLGGHLGKRVAQGGSDPLAWMDQKYGATKQVLDAHKNKPLKISTRSDLIGHNDYIDMLNPKKHSVEIHVFGDNEGYNRVLEPGAPSFKRRMKAAQKLRAAGIPVTIVHDKLPFKSTEAPDFNTINELKSMGFPIKENPLKISDKQLKNMSKVTGINFSNLMRKK